MKQDTMGPISIPKRVQGESISEGVKQQSL